MKNTIEAQQEARSSDAQRLLSRKDRPRGFYIMQDELGNNFRIETPESYANRKRVHLGRSSSVKKFSRINRVRQQGYNQVVATEHDVARHGPALKVGAE